MAKKLTPNPSNGSGPAPAQIDDQDSQQTTQPVSLPQTRLPSPEGKANGGQEGVEHPESLEKLVQEKESEEKAEIEEVSEYIKEAEVKPEVSDDLKALGIVSTDEKLEETFGGKEAVYLPLTEEEIKKGLHHQIVDAVRWLAEWSLKVIKWARHKGIQVILGRGSKKQEVLPERELEEQPSKL